MIEFKNFSDWQRSINAISSFISEGNFRFSDKGIFFKATDPSQVVLVDFAMEKASFSKYAVEPSFVGVDLVELSKILGRAGSTDKVQLDLTDSELILKIESDLSKNFRVPLIDVADDEVKIPNYKFDANIEINGKILKEALKDASLFGSSVVLRVNKNEFLIEARGQQGTLKTVAKGTKNIAITSSKEVVSKYSLNFFQNILREVENEQKVLLEIKSEAPMRISYNLGESRITFLLAHMIL